MRPRTLAAFIFLTVIAVLAGGVNVNTGQWLNDDEPKFRVRIAAADPGAAQARLERTGYDVLGFNAEDSTVDVAVSDAGLVRLYRSAWPILSVERARPFRDTRSGQSSSTSGMVSALAAATPTGYRDLDGVIGRLHEIAAAYPDIAQVVDLTATYNTPATFEGRHMFALKISDNVAVDEDETAMLIVSTHHAREIVAPVIALNTAEHLTSGYGIDPRVTTAVDGHEIWIAPVWNPDGYNYVFTTNNMWRKNRRVFSSGVGVDQNRNYPQGWSASCGGSTSVASETYKGPSAASEAETRTMIAWSEAERFAKVIDYHSSGREVLYSYRCLSHPFTSWMRQEATALSVASGYGEHTRLPSAEGEHQEWQFAKLGAYAFLIETHTEFQPPYESGLAEAEMVWPGVLAVLERPVSLTGHVTDAVTGAPLAATVELLNVSFANGETNSSGGAFGSYHMFAPAGTYDVRFSRDGYAPVVHRVAIGAATTTELDVQMSVATVVYSDTFETNTGWTRNPNGTDNATNGVWERGDPQSTTSDGLKQLGTTVSGVNDLVTGRLSGSSSGANDLDGGRSSIQSPPITLPASGTLTLSFSYYFAHGSNSSAADYLRVIIVGTSQATVLQELGAANDDDAVWASATVDISAFAGQTVRILIEAADLAGASLVEAAVDDVKIVRQ